MKFTMDIELCNDAMRTRRQLVQAIRKVADRIKLNAYPIKEEIDKDIMDLNGHAVVGSWHLKKK